MHSSCTRNNDDNNIDNQGCYQEGYLVPDEEEHFQGLLFSYGLPAVFDNTLCGYVEPLLQSRPYRTVHMPPGRNKGPDTRKGASMLGVFGSIFLTLTMVSPHDSTLSLADSSTHFS